MNIALLWKNDYPWDVRIEKIATALRDAGHRVFILAANAERRPVREDIDGLAIRRLPAPRAGWANGLVSMPFYLNPFWFKLARAVARDDHLDLVIVRDLPLITIGVHLRRRLGLPLVLDMAENYPALYRGAVHDAPPLRALARWLFKNPALMARVERWALRRVDHVLVVVEESAERLRALGVPAEKISIVSNTPRRAIAPPPSPTPPLVAAAFVLVYVGFVQDGRGLEVVVEALPRLRTRGVEARFVVVGDGESRGRLQALAQARGVADQVDFKGWVPHAQIGGFIALADAGVIPHTRNEHTDSTIPNKLFDYMMLAKPVLVSDARPLARIVTQADCGLVFRSDDADSLADAIVRMQGNRTAARAMGERGAAAVREHFHWEHDADVLRRAVDTFRARS